MTKEMTEINARFEQLKACARERLPLPEAFTEMCDIYCYNTLLLLYKNFKNGLLPKEEAEREDRMLRKDYIDEYRGRELSKKEIELTIEWNKKASGMPGRFLKDFDKMNFSEIMEMLAKLLDICFRGTGQQFRKKIAERDFSKEFEAKKTPPKKRKAADEGKTKFGSEFQKVRLSEEEYKKLIDKMGTAEAQKYIDALDYWLAEGHAKKNHYATILNWYRRDNSGKEEKAQDEPSYDWSGFMKKAVGLKYVPKGEEKNA